MELCEILTNIYGHNNWYNPYRNCGFSIGGSQQRPYDAYCELDEPIQRIARAFYGKEIKPTDGLNDESRPIDFTKYYDYENGKVK